MKIDIDVKDMRVPEEERGTFKKIYAVRMNSALIANVYEKADGTYVGEGSDAVHYSLGSVVLGVLIGNRDDVVYEANMALLLTKED